MASPTLAGPRKGPVRWRQKRGCLVLWRGVYKVRVEAELSEVLKPPDSVPRTPQPRTPGPSRSAQARPQVPRPRPMRFPETSRDRSPSGVSFRTPPRVTLGTQLSFTGISELALQSAAGWVARPIPGLERGCAPLPRPGDREPGAESRTAGVGGRAEVVCDGRAPLSPADCCLSSLSNSFLGPDGAPLLGQPGGRHAARRLETGGPGLSAPTEL